MSFFDLVKQAGTDLLGDVESAATQQKAAVQSANTIEEHVALLPASGVTISVLEALDKVVPGAWTNLRSFDAIIANATGEDVPAVIGQIHTRSEQLWTTDSRYKNALTVFTTVDTLDKVVAGAAIASKVGDMFGALDFLKTVTPKPETTQAIDAGLKLVAELSGFGLLNGLPQMSFDGVARFVVALADYGRADLMRIAAWVALDGMLPLGPEFMKKITGKIKEVSPEQLSGSGIFGAIADKLPGESVGDKRDFIVKAVGATEDWVGGFVEDKQLTPEKIKSQLGDALSLAEGGMDYVAAAIDATTAYFSHTGTQTVARVLAEKAHTTLKDELWAQHVQGLR